MTFFDHVYRYYTVQQSGDANGIASPETWTVEDVEEWLLEHAKSIMTDGSENLSASVDIFEHGFDRYVIHVF